VEVVSAHAHPDHGIAVDLTASFSTIGLAPRTEADSKVSMDCSRCCNLGISRRGNQAPG